MYLACVQVEVAAEVREGAPEQVEAVMSSMLTQSLTEASDLLLAPGVLERVQSSPVLDQQLHGNCLYTSRRPRCMR